jgi:uncharacterized oligopeptide transporter (OPT) family protein
VVVVAIDETLRRTVRQQFPPLAVALGIYLPMAVTIMVVIGAVAGKRTTTWVARGRTRGREALGSCSRRA